MGGGGQVVPLCTYSYPGLRGRGLPGGGPYGSCGCMGSNLAPGGFLHHSWVGGGVVCNVI